MDECEDEWQVVRTETSPNPDYALQVSLFDDDLKVLDGLREGGGSRLHERGLRLKVKDKNGRKLLWKDDNLSDMRLSMRGNSDLSSVYAEIGCPVMDQIHGHARG